MKLWTVKMGEVTLTKPLEMAQAARFAEQLVDVAESLCDVRVEFYAETIEEAEVRAACPDCNGAGEVYRPVIGQGIQRCRCRRWE